MIGHYTIILMYEKDVWDISTTAMKNPWKSQMTSNGERERGWASN